MLSDFENANINSSVLSAHLSVKEMTGKKSLSRAQGGHAEVIQIVISDLQWQNETILR